MSRPNNLRCQDEKFLELMTNFAKSDGGHSVKEQVSTEESVKSVYIEFIEKLLQDDE